jgi:hypothetical protein
MDMEEEIFYSALKRKIDHLYKDKVWYEVGIARIREYVESVEQLLNERISELDQDQPVLHSGMSEEEQEEALANHLSMYSWLEYGIANIQRYSLFVYSCLFFESKFKGIAESYAFMHNLKSYSSCYEHDKGIKRTRKYFKKIASIEWPEHWSKWEDINDLFIIRNLMVHNDGSLHRKEDKNPREDFLKRWKIDISTEGGEIELSQGFVFRVLDTFKIFIDELYAKFPDTPL